MASAKPLRNVDFLVDKFTEFPIESIEDEIDEILENSRTLRAKYPGEFFVVTF